MINPTKADVEAGRRVTLVETNDPKSLSSKQRGTLWGFSLTNGAQVLLDSALDFTGFRSYTTYPFSDLFWEKE